ncbi:MAG TPA: uridine diphosphate-N-acetylglucosamine-binding protein YvcK [Actinomycetes bacterium]|nr:uridine diphosphate-N-acetylglucosamine-binding protein YvcK [Actinomycetes bacterium]
MRVVALGGGHGLAVTLAALRLLGVAPTAVVAVADDGGSSGRLRRDLGLLPPGDLRKAMLALADPAAEVRELFGYRFERGDLAGHNLGNLALAALTDLKGGFQEALEEASRWLRVQGRVLPATLVPVRLCGLVDGRQVEGQVAIATASGRVESVWLEPREPAAVPAAVDAVRQADLVLLGPGSTFTSVVPNLLVPELAAALTEAERLVYICNLEAQPGETSGFPPEAHLAAILDHCPGLRVATVLCQRPQDAAAAARELRAFAELGAAVLHAEVAADDHAGRHDAARLATALKELA